MKWVFNVLRVLLFFPVLYFLFREVSFGQIQVALQQANKGLLFLALLFYVMKYSIQGLRWHNAALAHQLHYPTLFFVRTQIEIVFLEMALPIPDSEDALRVIKLRGLSVDVAKSTAVTLFDRIMGGLFLLILLPFSARQMADIVFTHSPVNYLFVLAGCIPLFLFALFYRKIIMAGLGILEKFITLNHSFFENIKRSMTQKINFRYRLYGLLWVIAYGLAGTFCAWLLADSVGASVPFISLLLCIPLFYISQTFPLSYQGLGLYEATLVFILRQMGVSNEQALITGTLHFIFHVLIIFIGAGLFIANPLKITDLRFSFKTKSN